MVYNKRVLNLVTHGYVVAMSTVTVVFKVLET